MSDLTPRCLHGTEWFALLGDVEAHARAMQRSRRPWLERLPIHGARGGWPRGKRNGMFKHGLYTKEAVE